MASIFDASLIGLRAYVLLIVMSSSVSAAAKTDEKNRALQSLDVFEIEYVSDPRITKDGESIVYMRNFMDIMTDSRRSNLWMINFDGKEHRPLTTGIANHSSPRFSPDGKRLLYVSGEDDTAQLYVRWLDTGQTAKITNLQYVPSGLSWSPDGKWIAFSMFVPVVPEPFVTPPPKPEGAKWADPPRIIDSTLYRFDGSGYARSGFNQLFIVPADGGTPRQVTEGAFHHNSAPVWTPDGKALIFSANRHDDWEYQLSNWEIYEVSIDGGCVKALTDRFGPDGDVALSPDGAKIAYTGYDDRFQGYQITKLYVMNRDGTGSRVLTETLDRDVFQVTWSADGKQIYFQFDDAGDTNLAGVDLAGNHRVLARGVGGLSLGRPYAAGDYSVAENGRFAFTQTTPKYPADLAVGAPGRDVRRITTLNADLFAFRDVGEVEEIRYESSFDGRMIQGWVVKPPDFDTSKQYPLILEIHGGPFANYGPRFTMEMQIFAAAGYVVLYANPRGSTSYGEEFGNLIHHNYPSQDYDDLMSGVDAQIERGYVDPDRLFITGGSGGGILTSWTIGKTDRFKAAVAAKPVINWQSFALTADLYTFFHKYWFDKMPWEDPQSYWKRSPLSLVGNVSTPTMLLTGEDDYRTPISESEQYYQALRLRKVEAVLVRIPGASHHITARPSQLIAKVDYILKWFSDHGGKTEESESATKSGVKTK